MSAKTIDECIKFFEDFAPDSSRYYPIAEETIRILRAVKKQREFIDREIARATNVSHSFTVTARTCDGCE
jgi:hypothetical protein